MTENLLLHVYRNNVDSLKEAVSSWRGEPDGARLVSELRDALRLCRSWPEEMRQLDRSLWKRGAANQIDDYQQTGEQVLDLFDRRLDALARLRDQATELERQRHHIEEAAELDQLREELSRMRQDFVDHWLWITEAIMEESRAEYARGDYQTVEEILRELQGPRP